MAPAFPLFGRRRIAAPRLAAPIRWVWMLVGVPSLALLPTAAALAQVVTEREAFDPVVQVNNATDSRSLTIGGMTDPLAKVRLGINFTKCDDPISAAGVCVGTGAPFYDEMGFRLRGPNGTTVTLVEPSVTFTSGGVSPGNTFSFVFEDAAAQPVSAALPASGTLVSGTYRPQSSLSAFTGLAGNGIWTLEFEDQGGRDPLSLNSWFISLTPAAVSNNPFISGVFTGQTLTVPSAGTFTQNFLLTNAAGNAIDLNGLRSTFSGVLSGPGGISFLNSGTDGLLRLTGQNTYTGSTTIQPGAHLAVDGSIASSSSLTVLPGARLSGNGILPRTALQPGALIAPGASIGQLTVAGDLSFNGATYSLEIQGPQNDGIQVGGNVTAFSGRVQLLPFGGGTALPGMTYVGLNAPASLPFASASSLNLDPAAILAGSVVLAQGTTLIQNSNGNPRQLAFAFQPRRSGAVASALEAVGAGSGNSLSSASFFDRAFANLAQASAGNGNASGTPIGVSGFTTGQAAAAGLSPAFVQTAANLLTISQPGQLAAALQTIAPENYASFQAVALNALRLQRDTLLQQAESCSQTGWVLPSGADTGSARRPLCVFALGGNSTASVSGSNGLFGYDAAIAAGFYGLEWKPAAAWTVGAAYGYGTANLSNLGVTAASVASNVGSGTLYGVFRPAASNLAIKGLLGYGRFNLDGRRSVAVIGTGAPITATTIADGVTTGLTAEMDLPLNRSSAATPVLLRPMLAIGYSSYQQLGFQEAGNDPLQLQVAGHTAQSLTGSLGAELSTRIALDARAAHLLIPRFNLAYQVDALANNTANTSLTATMPATGFATTTLGQNFGSSELLIGGSVELQLAGKASLFAGVNYQIYDNGSQFGYGGGLRYSF